MDADGLRLNVAVQASDVGGFSTCLGMDQIWLLVGGEETRKRRCQGWLPGFLAKFLKLEIPVEKLFGRKDDVNTSDI